MKEYLVWLDDHGNEESQDAIVLRALTEGTITDSEEEFSEWQYKVDFDFVN